MLEDTEEAYVIALIGVNEVLRQAFPKSFSIVFIAPTVIISPLELPECGQRDFIFTAVQYPKARVLMLEYISLVQRPTYWYSDLFDENSALVSTFAVFALTLFNREYLSLVKSYLIAINPAQRVQGLWIEAI